MKGRESRLDLREKKVPLLKIQYSLIRSLRMKEKPSILLRRHTKDDALAAAAPQDCVDRGRKMSPPWGADITVLAEKA